MSANEHDIAIYVRLSDSGTFSRHTKFSIVLQAVSTVCSVILILSLGMRYVTDSDPYRELQFIFCVVLLMVVFQVSASKNLVASWKFFRHD